MKTNEVTKQFHITIDGVEIPVTEEVYRAYKQPIWKERKRKEREARCVVGDGNGGTKRCDKDCSQCPHQRTGSVLSMDKLLEDGLDVDSKENLESMVAENILTEQLHKAINSLDESDRDLIAALFYKNETERSFAATVGKSHQAVNKQKNKILVKLRNILDSEN